MTPKSAMTPDSAPPDFVLLSGDLLFASRVKSAVEAAGKSLYLGGQLPEGDLSAVTMVILDLSTRSGLTGRLPTIVADRCPNARTLAYGPHVQVAKLKAAREAGFDRVLTNGQFDAGLGQLVGGDGLGDAE